MEEHVASRWALKPQSPDRTCQELPADGLAGTAGERRQLLAPPRAPRSGHHEQVISGYVTEAPRTSSSPQEAGTRPSFDGEELDPSSPGQLLASKWQKLIQKLPGWP